MRRQRPEGLTPLPEALTVQLCDRWENPTPPLRRRTARTSCGVDEPARWPLPASSPTRFRRAQDRGTGGYVDNVSAVGLLGGYRMNPVTEDEMYLASRIEQADGGTLSPAALQRLNTKYGTPTVTGALRRLRGFPPEDPILSVYAYVEALCQMEATAWSNT